MVILRSLLTLLSVSSLVASGTIDPRGKQQKFDVAFQNKWKDHDKVEAIKETPDPAILGEMELKFSPFLYVEDGCVPYPAVDKDGYAGAGLKPTGKATGDCVDLTQPGQMYARVARYKTKEVDRLAIVYTVYVPKIQHNDEKHRHGFLYTVTWFALSQCPITIDSVKPVYVTASVGNGAFESRYNMTYFDPSGTHPLLTYKGGSALVAASMYDAKRRAFRPPLVGWSAMPAPAREQLNNIDYELTSVPFSDANIHRTLEASYPITHYANIPPDPDCGVIIEPVSPP